MDKVMSGTTFTSTAVGVDTTPDRWYHVLVNLLGAVALGLVAATAMFEIGSPAWLLQFVVPPPGSRPSWFMLVPLVGLVIAVPAALGQIRGLLRFGWLIAAIGAAGMYSTRWWPKTSNLEVVVWVNQVYVVIVALLLAGVLLAFSAAGLWSRRAIVLGFTLATVAQLVGLVSLSWLALAAAGVGTVAFAVTVTRRPTASSERAAGRPALVIGLTGLGVGVVYLLIALYRTRNSPADVPLGQRITPTNDLVSDGGRVLIALAIVLALGLVAARRGGSSLARWAVAGFGLGLATVINLDLPFANWYPTSPTLRWLVLGLSAVIGVFVVARWDRGLPWDAIGVLVLAAGLYLHVRPSGLDAYAEHIDLTLAGALAFVLAAGLTRLVGPGRGLDTGPAVAGSAALGLAAFILGTQVAGQFIAIDLDRADLTMTVRTYVLGGIAIALIVLFGLGRRRIAHASTARPKLDTVTPDPALAVTEPQATVPL